jgi:hypothetical protein
MGLLYLPYGTIGYAYLSALFYVTFLLSQTDEKLGRIRKDVAVV